MAEGEVGRDGDHTHPIRYRRPSPIPEKSIGCFLHGLFSILWGALSVIVSILTALEKTAAQMLTEKAKQEGNLGSWL